MKFWHNRHNHSQQEMLSNLQSTNMQLIHTIIFWQLFIYIASQMFVFISDFMFYTMKYMKTGNYIFVIIVMVYNSLDWIISFHLLPGHAICFNMGHHQFELIFMSIITQAAMQFSNNNKTKTSSIVFYSEMSNIWTCIPIIPDVCYITLV